MKKTFPLQQPDQADARVIEAVKHDIRKYVKRERRKTLPEGFDQWDFACRVGVDASAAEPKPLKEVPAAIDQVAAGGATSVYVEILAAAGHRYAGITPPPTET